MHDIEGLPEWSQPIERERRERGLTIADVSAAASKGATWWYTVRFLPSPPKGWDEIKTAIEERMKR